MCGLAGFLQPGGFELASAQHTIGAMTRAIARRGPDDEGYWLDHSLGVALGHRRLSILDLSAAGHQPMSSRTGRYVAIYNGEIYNHVELRYLVEHGGNGSHAWRGHSDTEVLLAGFERWGVEKTLQRLVGMFAIAVWDRAERALYLARDRMGEKPLYYGWQAGTFLFASELKALKQHPAFIGRIHRAAISLLLRHSCIPAPYSIYEGIQKLPPASVLKISIADASAQVRNNATTEYWSLDAVARNGERSPTCTSTDDCVAGLEARLVEAIKLQMVADVPLGAFLSGGIDSSTVTAIMQAQSSQPIRTFTIGFTEVDYDEARYAREVAHHLGTQHTELYVTPTEAMAVIPQMPLLYDEPFSDSSQIPTFLVARMARPHVKVALSGDGGDELFGGYNRHFRGAALWRSMQRLPLSARRGIACALLSVSPKYWSAIYGYASFLLPPSLRTVQVGDKVQKLGEVLGSSSAEEFYTRLVSHWEDPARIVLGHSAEPTTPLKGRLRAANLSSIEHQMMFLDAASYLGDDVLVKVDRAAMGVSLETRAPFLDHRVVEAAWRIPLNAKIHHGVGKWVIRRLLERYVPKKLFERPKMGFGLPIGAWLRGPMKDWAAELLDEGRLKREGFFDPQPIRRKWLEHQTGRRNWQGCLWDVLMFQSWLETHNG